MGTMNGKVCIVTGGNTGIGKETVRGLATEGATMVLACRDVRKGEAAKAEIAQSVPGADVRVRALDLASLASVRAFARDFKADFDRLDVLVNNAGVWTRERETTADGLELTFGTNHVGHFLLTTELLELLKQSAPARIVNVSSKLHYRGKMQFDDLQFERRTFGGTEAYNQSKLANVLFTNALAERLAGTGVTVNALHPGVVATDLARKFPAIARAFVKLFFVTPEEGARTSLFLATSPAVEGVSGRYFESSREKTAAKQARDRGAQETLWRRTEELLAAHGKAAA